MEKSNIKNKNIIQKAGVVGIIILLVVSAFIPGVCSENYKTKVKIDSDDNLKNIQIQEDEFFQSLEVDDFVLNDPLPLDRDSDDPPTFYEDSGRWYVRPSDYNELVSWYLKLEQNYSDYIDVFKANELYGTGTVPKNGGGSYDLYYVRITNESRGFHKPEVLFSGGPHGNEKIGAIGLYWSLDWLMRHAFHPDYDCPERDYLKWLLDNREIYIDVFHNPDGFDRNVRGDYLGRDLNREGDHDASWGPFDSVNGQTLMRFVNNHTLRTATWYHCGARKLLYPWQQEHSSITGISPISGESNGHVPADFYYFDASGLRLGDYIGDYGGDLGSDEVGSSYSMGLGGPGVLTSWGYGSNNLSHPLEDSYVEIGPHLGAGILTWDPEAHGNGNPAESTYGNDTTARFGAEVRRLLLYLTDIAQPYVRWIDGSSDNYIEIDPDNGNVSFEWQVNGSLVVDHTYLQWGSDPDPINYPDSTTIDYDTYSGEYYGGTGWDNAEDGEVFGVTYSENLDFDSPGDYYVVAKAMVDQVYDSLLREDYYGEDSYLRMIEERTNASFYESLSGTDGLEEINGQLWWYSPVFHVHVRGDSWYNTSWPHRKKITLNHSLIDEDINDFPVMIQLNDADLASDAQFNGNDIFFTSSNNIKLDHEIEYYDSGDLVAWVNIPYLLSTEDTSIYMYFGNLSVGNQQNPTDVWDDDFMMVQHLDEISGTHYDSTSHDNDGSPINGVVQDAVGQIDGADDFDGSDDYVEIPHDDNLTGFTEAMTASAWIKLDQISSRQTIMNKYNTSNNQRGWAFDFITEGGTGFGYVASSTGVTNNWVAYTYSHATSTDTWYYVTVVWESDQIPKMYVDGVELSTSETDTVSSIYNNEVEPLIIGRAYPSSTPSGRHVDGIIDEVRISDIARSAEWIKTSYLNQYNPDIFYEIGPKEGPMFVTSVHPFDGDTNIPLTLENLSFSLLHFENKSMDYSVETYPDIGSDMVTDVGNGQYPVSVSSLDECTTYTWYVNVSDGSDEIHEVFSFTTECLAPWWNDDWLYRKEITIDHSKVEEDLTDFPILIELSDSDLESNAQIDGDDIVFASDMGVKLDHEIEFYNEGNLFAWVKLPFLSSTIDTIIFMYYGNMTTDNQENPEGVWDDNFVMIQHLDETTGTHYDSTDYENDGSPNGGVIQDAIGQIDGADDFDGSDDYVEIPHDDNITGFTEAMTASVWVKLDDNSARQAFLNKYETATDERGWEFDYITDPDPGFGLCISPIGETGQWIAYTYDYLVETSVWYYVTTVWESDEIPKMYINGIELSTDDTGTISSIYNNTGAPLYIGRSYASASPGGRYLDGIIDEARVSNIARSEEWIKTNYNNQLNPNEFYNVGIEESEYPIVYNPIPLNGATDISKDLYEISFMIKDLQNDPMDYTVETVPYIGSDSAVGVDDGRYSVPVSGLDFETLYTWYVNVTDGTHITSQVYSFTTEIEPAPWWNTEWSFRKEITIDHTKVEDNHVNFPVLIDLYDSDLAIKAQGDGDDIVFSNETGFKLDHEIEYYNDGYLVAWVKIPYFSATSDTIIYLYYGNSSATNQENTENVWDSNYMMVQHLDETTGTHYDSTINNNNGNPENGVVQDASGQIDGANHFDGTNDYVNIPHADTLAGFTENFTASVWIKTDTTGTRRGFLCKYDTSGSQRGYNIESPGTDANSIQFTASADGASYEWWKTDFTPTADTWYYITVCWASNELPTFYINGEKSDITGGTGLTISQIYNNNLEPLYIGGSYSSDRFWDGGVDEARISNVNRSAEWIKTCYNNQYDPDSFFDVGLEEMGLAPDEPFLYSEYPLKGATLVDIDPVLLISVLDYQDEIVDVVFYTNASGSWDIIGGNYSVVSGTYSQSPTNMDEYDKTYYWRVNATDYSGYWTDKTYYFKTRLDNYPPVVSNPSPSNGQTNVGPIPYLSIDISDIDGDLMNISFNAIIDGNWENIESFFDVSDGTYNTLPMELNELGTTYYWSVNCTDGTEWVNNTYHYTMTSSILSPKWTRTLSSATYGGTVAADVTGDGVAEVFHAGSGRATCVDGATGVNIWDRAVSGGSGQPQMADCNGDGVLDLIVTIASSGIEVLHGLNGTTYWRTTGLGGSSMNSPVAFDIDGDGCAEVFYSSQDISNGWNGTGRVTSLTHDGQVVNQIFAFRPCAGGLSLADTNFDGQFELYMGDRHQNYPDCWGVPRGLRAFLIEEDGYISCNWNKSNILMSSHCPMIADVTGDGNLEIIACHQRGGIHVVDPEDGSTIVGSFNVICSDGYRYPGHYQMSICDIDYDGNLEVLAADGDHPEPYTTDDVAIWDLIEWQEDGLLPHVCKMGPQTGDVTGDGKLDVLVCSFQGVHIYTWNDTADDFDFIEQRTGLSGHLGPAVVTDIDGDNLNELVVGTSNGHVYVYDTPAPSPTPRALSGIQFYSTYRNGQAIYTEPPGIPRPLIKDVSPANDSINVDLDPTLSIRVIDYQHDLINITVSTNASGSWENIAGYTDMKTGQTYNIETSDFNKTNKFYYWKVTATDGTHTTSEIYHFKTYTPAPFKMDWLYRKKITLNQSQIADDLEGFPVLIDMYDLDVASKAQSDGDDILFTSSDGITKLDHEIEFYDDMSGHLVCWVKADLDKANVTFIYLYYGNPSASNQQNPEDVWDEDFMMVQHLDEASGIHYDSTDYNNDGTPMNGIIQDISGKIDGCDQLDGSDDNINVVHNDSIAGFTEGMTLSTWVRFDTLSARQSLIVKYDTSGNQRAYYLDYVTNPGFTVYASQDGSSYEYWSISFSPVVDQWYHVAFVWAPDTIPRFFVDGQQIGITGGSGGGSNTLTQIYNNTLEPLQIGRSYTSGRELDGMIDEVRISDIARSDSWIETSANNQNNPSGFCNIGSEESAPVVNYTDVLILPNTQSVGLGDTFVVSVFCDPAQPIAGYEFDLMYDSSLIHASSVSEGDIFDEYSTYFNDGTIDNTAGLVDNIYGLIIEDGNISDPGYCANITFTAQSTIGTSLLGLIDVGITNESAYVAINVVNGSVSVQTVVDIIPPEISDVSILMSDPLDNIIGWENISCTVVDNDEVDTVYLNLTYPDMHIESLPMVKSGDMYYYNATLSDVGSYSYHIWAEDVNGNSNSSVTDSFEMPPNWDINIDHDCSIVDLIQVANHFDETGTSGWIREDVNNDGDVSIVDLIQVANHFDETW